MNTWCNIEATKRSQFICKIADRLITGSINKKIDLATLKEKVITKNHV